MKITSEQMKSFNPCADGLAWFESVKVKTPKGLLKAAGKDEQKLQWCNWAIARLLSRENSGRYAIYAARKVLHIYEEKYPNDDRPKRAIDAAEKYLNRPNEENRKAAYAAGRAADAASRAAAVDAAAYAAGRAADAASRAAAVDAAAYAVDAAAYAADAAVDAADAASRAAAYAADAASRAAAYAADAAAYAAADVAAYAEMKINIISYGIKLLEKQK